MDIREYDEAGIAKLIMRDRTGLLGIMPCTRCGDDVDLHDRIVVDYSRDFTIVECDRES